MKASFLRYSVDADFPIAFYAIQMSESLSFDWSAAQLIDHQIEIPETPSYNTWKQLVYSKRKCGFCWATLRGTAEDMDHHIDLAHRSSRVAP